MKRIGILLILSLLFASCKQEWRNEMDDLEKEVALLRDSVNLLDSELDQLTGAPFSIRMESQYEDDQIMRFQGQYGYDSEFSYVQKTEGSPIISFLIFKTPFSSYANNYITFEGKYNTETKVVNDIVLRYAFRDERYDLREVNLSSASPGVSFTVTEFVYNEVTGGIDLAFNCSTESSSPANLVSGNAMNISGECRGGRYAIYTLD
jgi:hypothetical protein